MVLNEIKLGNKVELLEFLYLKVLKRGKYLSLFKIQAFDGENRSFSRIVFPDPLC